uniref:Uncharacterized protein n=1 Tax=viral metagenome TaxID=1070528 RepID=A0A6M3KZ10_9ZZZZ
MLHELHRMMREYNGRVAYGSECQAWGDFVASCYDEIGMAPWDDRGDTTDVPTEMVAYWTDVANGENSDYDLDGGRID